MRRDWRDAAVLLLIGGAVAAALASVSATSVPGWNYERAFLALLLWIVVVVGWFATGLALAVPRPRAQPLRRVVAWALVPALALATLFLCVSSLPLRARLELSRGALDEAARDVARGGRPPKDGRLGLFEIHDAQRIENGFAFLVEDAGFIDTCGLAYSRGGEPRMGSGVWHVSGPWYGWCEDF